MNKIDSVSNPAFKGYQHIKNDFGETIMKFNYPYDSDKETCEIHFYRAEPTEKYNYKLSEKPIAVVSLKPEGVNVNLQNITNLDKDAPFAYKIVRKDKQTGDVVWEGADTGVKIKPENGEYVFRVHVNDKELRYEKDKNGKVINIYEDFKDDPIVNYTHTLVSRAGTTPMIQGAGYLVTPDALMPGAMYRGFSDVNTGEIYYDRDAQKRSEGIVKNFSNVLGGSLAGLQYKIKYLKDAGYTYMFSTPIANGSKGWSLGYWNKNNNQVSSNMGNTENFASFFKELYSNGMKYVYDGTFTSEGLEGIHFQYARRWADKNPQTYYWFKMSGIKKASIGYGVIPRNAENMSHRLINAPYNYELQSNGTYKRVANPNYNENKETYLQIYDKAQASEEQIKALDKEIINYEKLLDGKEIDFTSHDDTTINYTWQIDWKDYDKNIYSTVNEFNKKNGRNIRIDSPEGTEMVCQFPDFKLIRKTEGGSVTWDANTDMEKMNYHISGYDEKLLQEIQGESERSLERQMIVRGAREVQDLAIQSGKYWTGKVKDIQTMYTAKIAGNAKTVEELDKLVKEGKLPKLKSDNRINDTVLSNILNGYYVLEPKGVLSKDDVTVKSLMRLPLDTLEFGENTTGVLSTSYFSNRATTDETIGVSRFDLMKQNNPHLVEPYTKNYKKVNSLFNNEIKNFADKIIKKVNQTSNEKLLDANGDYTEYGEYVMELVGQDITKYAFLKSLGGEHLKTKLLDSGEITYDYDHLKENTTLKALNINANNPEEEAAILESRIEKGLKKLNDNDVSYAAKSISKRIAGTDTSSFRIAEAWVDRSGLGLDWRLDAAKDVMDMDAIRNEDDAFDDNWNDVINFWSKFTKGIKQENPNAYIIAEITDIPELIRDTYGADAHPYDGATNIGQRFNGEPDAFVKFFNESGVTSEAGYSYFFTDLLTIFAPSFDEGNGMSANHDRFKNRLEMLLQTRSVDYLRNLYTFMGNHDKPRMIHGLSLDMEMFHSDILDLNRGHRTREAAIQVLSGAKTPEDVPIELRLNVDNNDYFLTVGTRAVTMSKLLMDVVNEDLKGIASEDDRKRIIDALVDLTNGNYLGKGVTESMSRIRLKELQTLEGAFGEILSLAEKNGLKLSEDERKSLIEAVVKKANQKVSEPLGGNCDGTKNLPKYLVRGDFDWTDIDENVKKQNNEFAAEILGAKSDYSKYSLYTIQLARLLKDSYKEAGVGLKSESAINSAIKEFAEKYDKQTVVSNTSEPKRIEDPVTAMRKNGYAARDIKLAISMAVKQAEFKSGKPVENKQKIIDAAYKYATEPGVAKAAMIMEFLKGLPGIPTMYGGDELGMTGYEEKAKNVYLQNRSVLPWTETEGESDISKYRRSVMAAMNGALKDRSSQEFASLNDGTPYALEVKANNRTRSEAQDRINKLNRLIDEEKDSKKKMALEEERRRLSKDFAKIAYMMHSVNGNMTVTLFNAGDVEYSNRFDYFKKYGLNTEEKRRKFFAENNIESIDENNRYVPIMPKSEVDAIMLAAGVAVPVGTIFTNANAKDRTQYVVKEIGGKLGIVRKDGGKIVMDGKTSKNGVMVLKHIKNMIFRGNSKKRVYYNNQYNFVSGAYNQTPPPEEGRNLSIISK